MQHQKGISFSLEIDLYNELGYECFGKKEIKVYRRTETVGSIISLWRKWVMEKGTDTKRKNASVSYTNEIVLTRLIILCKLIL